jgi:hypothetical protein
MSATDVPITGLTAKTENMEHKLYRDSSSPALFNDLRPKTVGLLNEIEK